MKTVILVDDGHMSQLGICARSESQQYTVGSTADAAEGSFIAGHRAKTRGATSVASCQ
jgi:hypothetical protein